MTKKKTKKETTCETCKWCIKDKRILGWILDPADPVYECRRFPPDINFPIVGSDWGNTGQWSFNDICGEYERK